MPDVPAIFKRPGAHGRRSAGIDFFGDLKTVYTSYVRPALEYAAPVWHSSLNNVQTAKLERFQRRACIIILGTQYTDYTSALSTLELTTLADRRIHICTKFAKSLLRPDFRD
ncbi:hypothetical protein Bbelb_025450 [Branchiostoma belcheri]|nr:hypothetical protein Bbelb_025450 [Branchiostoma belcheri]